MHAALTNLGETVETRKKMTRCAHRIGTVRLGKTTEDLALTKFFGVMPMLSVWCDSEMPLV